MSGRATRPDVRRYDVQWDRPVFRAPVVSPPPPICEFAVAPPRFGQRQPRREALPSSIDRAA
ncbi:MAG: hypothetical protein HZC55_16895 [Verrucomicrobia bacterium]|nr:hypothetical protein [Verrucomicrobiota bacterium]